MCGVGAAAVVGIVGVAPDGSLVGVVGSAVHVTAVSATLALGKTKANPPPNTPGTTNTNERRGFMWNAPGQIMPEFSTFVWYYFRGWLPREFITLVKELTTNYLVSSL